MLVAALSITMFLFAMHSSDAFAQFASGGVDHDGTWYLGEGLERGDYFHYTMCHVDYKECKYFDFGLWVKGDVTVGTESQLLAEVLVRDDHRVIVGNMTLSKSVVEPTDSSPELDKYRRAFGSSVAWLSAFASVDYPRALTDMSWGKNTNIGGPQVRLTAIENVTVPAGTWEAVRISWKTGGYVSNVWVVDEFPFPIKAATHVHVSEGIPPTEYEFILHDYAQNVQENPFAGIPSSDIRQPWCNTDVKRTVAVKGLTADRHYMVDVSYGPEDPAEDCKMEWLIKFIQIGDGTEFLNQVQFDFLVLDGSGNVTRSVASDEGKRFLYAPSGQYLLDVTVKEDAGPVDYAVWIFGQAPDWVVPEGPRDHLIIPVTIFPGGERAGIQSGMKDASVAEAGSNASPLQQARAGTPASEIECNGSRVLMTSPSGMPACVFAGSATTLERRGFVLLSETPNGIFPAKQPDMSPDVTAGSGTGSIMVTGSEEYSVEYDLTTGNILNITSRIDRLTIAIATTEDGTLTLTMPGSAADAMIDGSISDEFYVLVDFEEVHFEYMVTDESRTFVVDFQARSKEIAILTLHLP